MASEKPRDGRSTRWDQHRRERRAELVEAAVRAIDAIGPDASVAEIAQEAGVSKPVVYRYFADKAELKAAIGRWGIELVLERVMPAILQPLSPRRRVVAGVEAYLETIAERRNVFLMLAQASGSDPLAEGKQMISAVLTRLLGEEARQRGLDSAAAEPWGYGLVGLMLSVGQWWLERQTMSQEAVTRYMTDLVWHAIEGTARRYGIPLDDFDRLAVVEPIRKETDSDSA